MIRKISKKCDYRDIIRSCPTGVIDDIHTIKYFIAGHPETEYEASFTKKGTVLEVILPSSELELLPSGILMRRAMYTELDPVFPDGEYNLEFVDNLNVWLGEDEVDPSYDPGYLTEDDLKTINGESLVGTGNIDVVSFIPSYYATQSWVLSQGYITSENIPSGLATQSWVTSQGYLTSASITGYATQAWVQSQGYITSENIPSGLATQSWVSDHFLSTSALNGYATESWVQSQTSQTLIGYATEAWVLSQGYITSSNIPSGLATQSWVSQNFLSTTALTGYATQTWVQNQGYLTSHQDLSSYATQSWVQNQGYASMTDLTGYATQSWVSSYYLEESKVWVGTQNQWDQLTAEEKSTYKIALVTA